MTISSAGGYNAKVAEGIATAEDEIMLEEAHHWFEKRSAVSYIAESLVEAFSSRIV